MPTLKQIIDIVKPEWNYPFDDRDLFEDISADKLSYNKVALVADGVEIVCERPRLMFARVLALFDEPKMQRSRSVQNIWISHGSNFPIASGDNCVIGGAGFGYERDENEIPIRVHHLGNVCFGKNVEIGSNVCIDRAVIGSTIIGDNVKIDNLVHIAHGAKIGENTLIVAGSVIGGSCEIGKNCFIGMNASIKNKVKIGNNVIIGAGAVVLKDVPDGETWVGNPARQLLGRKLDRTRLPELIISEEDKRFIESNAKEVPMPIKDYKDSAHDDLALPTK